MDEEGKLSTQKNVFRDDEFILDTQMDICAKKTVVDRWKKVCAKGSPARIYKTIDLPYMMMYICPNNVGALVLHREVCYSFMNVRKGCVIAKGIPFINVNGNSVSFPFPAKVIECWEPACREYAGIFQVLK